MDQQSNRRVHDRYTVRLDIVDDENPESLTVSEVKELKRLANLSKIARLISVAILGIVAAVGIPDLVTIIKNWFK